MVDLTFLQGHNHFSIQNHFGVVPSRPRDFKMTPPTTGFFRFCNGQSSLCVRTPAFLCSNTRRRCAIKTSQSQMTPPTTGCFRFCNGRSYLCARTQAFLYTEPFRRCAIKTWQFQNDPPDNRFFPVLRWSILLLCKVTHVSLYKPNSTLCHQDLTTSK